MSTLSAKDIACVKSDVLGNVNCDLLKKIRLIAYIEFLGESALFVTDEDEMYAIGFNRNSKLGIGVTGKTTLPIKVEELSNKRVTAFAAGLWHCLALTEKGHVYGWGDNSEGQLGQGNRTHSSVPVYIASLSKVKQICCGYKNSIALTDYGEIYAWGYNYYKEGGSVNDTAILSPRKVVFPDGAVIDSISCGRHHTAALSKEGKVYCYGYNGNGELGNGNVGSNNPIPGLVMGQPAVGIGKVVCGAYHTIACSKDGEVFGWGYNLHRLLGIDQSSKDVPNAKKIVGLTNVQDVYSVFNNHISMAKTSSGIYVWGTFGNVGGGDFPNIDQGEVFIEPRKVFANSFTDLLHNRLTCSIKVKDIKPVSETPVRTPVKPNDPTKGFPGSTIDSKGSDSTGQLQISCGNLLVKMSRPYFVETLKNGNAVLSDFSTEVYLSFIKYVSTHEVESQDVKELVELYKIASYYGTDGLKEKITERLEKIMVKENAQIIYDAAVFHRVLELQDIAAKFIAKSNTTIETKKEQPLTCPFISP